MRLKLKILINSDCFIWKKNIKFILFIILARNAASKKWKKKLFLNRKKNLKSIKAALKNKKLQFFYAYLNFLFIF